MSCPAFSLIVATFGRYKELEVFLQSVTTQTIDVKRIQVIVVDQNDALELQPLIQKYQELLNLDYIKSKKKGLSYNRNLGLEIAKGEIVAFPDDDCMYYPDTLESVLRAFEQNPKTRLVLGRIIDRQTGKPIIRNWSTDAKNVTKLNFLTNSSSITLFSKWRESFDERLGSGSYFGSCEDLDFIFRYLEEYELAHYDPSIEVWHPEQPLDSIQDEKIVKYGLGFGGLARKHWSWVFAYLFAGVLAFHSLGWVKALLHQDKTEMRKRWLSVSSRLRGFGEFHSGKE